MHIYSETHTATFNLEDEINKLGRIVWKKLCTEHHSQYIDCLMTPHVLKEGSKTAFHYHLAWFAFNYRANKLHFTISLWIIWFLFLWRWIKVCVNYPNSPAVAVLVIFKVDFTIFIHYCGFWDLAPYFDETPVVLQCNNNEKNISTVVQHQMAAVTIKQHSVFNYLEDDTSEDLHVLSD